MLINNPRRRGAFVFAILAFSVLITLLIIELNDSASDEKSYTFWAQPNQNSSKAPISREQYGLSHVSFASLLSDVYTQPNSVLPITLSQQTLVSINHFVANTVDARIKDRFFYLLEKTIGREDSEYVKKTMDNYQLYTQRKNQLTEKMHNELSSKSATNDTRNTSNEDSATRYNTALQHLELHIKIEHLQQALFSKRESQTIFGKENAQTRYFLNRKIALLNPTLSDEERKEQLDNTARKYKTALEAYKQISDNVNSSSEETL
ncbi:lipase secretion chaperone [Alteromonas sp. S167]|uniref:lipase secretion chaperone n=1 Tax=Alteromonas sp. S167 TaxID=3117402 RepID=UPI002FE272E3